MDVDVDIRVHAHPAQIVLEVAWADEQRVRGLADGIRNEVACQSRHGSVDRIHAPDGDGQEVA